MCDPNVKKRKELRNIEHYSNRKKAELEMPSTMTSINFLGARHEDNSSKSLLQSI